MNAIALSYLASKSRQSDCPNPSSKSIFLISLWEQRVPHCFQRAEATEIRRARARSASFARYIQHSLTGSEFWTKVIGKKFALNAFVCLLSASSSSRLAIAPQMILA